MQSIFGSAFITKLGLGKTNSAIRLTIYENLGDVGVCFFDKIIHMMEDEFYNKYYKYVFQFTGLTAPLKKAKKYNEINYDAVYKVIDDFSFKQNNKKTSANDNNKSK